MSTSKKLQKNRAQKDYELRRRVKKTPDRVREVASDKRKHWKMETEK